MSCRRIVLLLLMAAPCAGSLAHAGERLDRIRQRGVLGCGIAPQPIVGFANRSSDGRYSGFDADLCRAIAAAILGSAGKVRFHPVASVQSFLDNPDIDIVSRRLTWTLDRETRDTTFGPITFFDGQGFLVARALGVQTPSRLAGRNICVEAGTSAERLLDAHFRQRRLVLKKVLIPPGDSSATALLRGHCQAFSADISELAALKGGLPEPDAYDILSDVISKEPLAPLLRSDDRLFASIVRWTVFALVLAEELGVSSKNVDALRSDPRTEVRRFVGAVPGAGRNLELDDAWAYRVVKEIGNYGEIFDRNLGEGSRIKLKRGLNALWTSGGLQYAPPLQ
jgi:general L-amino acid transport system substrate-binding protein